MANIKVITLAVPRKKRCPACDRTLPVEHKILLVKGLKLLGDLELCQDCSGIFSELAGNATEQVVAEWNFGGE